MKILVAEDSYPTQHLLQTLLMSHGYQVVTAENGLAALEKLRAEKVDLIISDVLMPEMDGFQLCRAVKTNPAFRHIPFVVYTATYIGAEDEAFARGLGADAFLIKPQEAEPLLQTLRTLLERGFSEQRHLPHAAPLEMLPELDFFKQYNVRLIKKLEDKVTLLDEAGRQLRSRENLFHTLADFAPVGIFEIDVDGHLLYANTQWSDITGLSLEEAADTSWLTRLHGDDRDRVQHAWTQALAAQRPFQSEFRFLGRHGEITWVWGQARPTPPVNGTAPAYVGAFTDVTRHRRLEEEKTQLQARLYQAQKLEAIGTMVGGIAHDFNNLLSSILGYAELAQHGLPAGGHAHDDLNLLILAAERARDLTQQLLLFSRERKEPVKPLQLAAIVREAIRLLRVKAPANVALVETIAAELPSVKAHPTQIHQIVFNLVTNAFHALRERSGAVRVALAAAQIDQALTARLPELRPGAYLALTVRDTGSGIPAEVLPRIFDPFFTTKPPGEGTGMGLSVVHGIVRDYGGAIDVDSARGNGTAFTVYLPAVFDNTLAAPAIPEGGGARILFVDDEEALLRMTVRMLEKLRYRVAAFADPAAALAAFCAAPESFDLVLTDLDMPTLTGLELAAEVLKIRPEVPIVLTTGVKPQRATLPGIRELLLKPFDFRSLAATLAQARRPSSFSTKPVA